MSNLFTEEALHKKSPQELTALLYEACLTNLDQAIDEIKDKNFVAANNHLQKANEILHRLGAGINYEAGIIADQLDALYNYMADKLIEANYNKDIKLIEEVRENLQEIARTWNEALQKKNTPIPKLNRQKTMAYEKNVLVDN
ncbi:flagellar export chaperone FliS [Bacillus solimangrovi]|uniref:Flagellar export chaperone FliS n=1 Tax=Bacillus solimangrovi TaxID=1305675 RepID=A0A1E5LDM7_9BACI|nr:flagellar export chaperone FliS [Bacillus solimangrovi]OEH92191.1 flagellar export chaperone FliS [Bacillus solimangrovi]